MAAILSRIPSASLSTPSQAANLSTRAAFSLAPKATEIGLNQGQYNEALYNIENNRLNNETDNTYDRLYCIDYDDSSTRDSDRC